MRSFLPAYMAVFALLGACRHPDERSFSSLGAPTYQPPARIATARLEYVRSIGASDGPLSFSTIPSLAARSDGTVAVLDRFNCQVVLIDSAGMLIRRFGRCGRGPGEFVTPWRLAFLGDSLVVFDDGQGAFLFMDLHGNEGRRLHLGELPGAVGIRGFAFENDTTLLVGKTLNATVYTDNNELVAIVDRRTGRERAGVVQDVPISIGSQRAMTRSIYLCGSNGNNANAHVVIGNLWQAELVSFDDFPEAVSSHTVTTVDWLPIRFDSRGPKAPRPPSMTLTLACGDETFAAMYRVLDFDKRPAAVRQGMLEVRSYDGQVLVRDIWTETQDSVFFGTPMAASREYYYFVDNARYADYPVVRVYRLVMNTGKAKE
jgi:hypothetical protein